MDQDDELRAGSRWDRPAGEPATGVAHPVAGTVVRKTTETPRPPRAGYVSRAELDRRQDALELAVARALENLTAAVQRALDARDARIAELEARLAEPKGKQ